jgi:hypothetical protein
MGGDSKNGEDKIRIERAKRRVRTPLKTGTVVHKSPKTYTRKEKHKKKPEDGGDE